MSASQIQLVGFMTGLLIAFLGRGLDIALLIGAGVFTAALILSVPV